MTMPPAWLLLKIMPSKPKRRVVAANRKKNIVRFQNAERDKKIVQLPQPRSANATMKQKLRSFEAIRKCELQCCQKKEE